MVLELKKLRGMIMKKFKEFIKSKDFKWLNIFIRDILLILVIAYVQVKTYFNSKWVWFITGMIVVWVSWQYSDYNKFKREQKWIYN
jgi:hypothetical protein